MFKEYLWRLWNACIDLIFPKEAVLSYIESLSPAEFAAIAQKSTEELPDGIVSLFRYRDKYVRRALWAIKYEGNANVAELLAILLSDLIIDVERDARLFENFIDPIIIPIPLSAERRKERGWNQAQMIAQKIVKRYPHFKLETEALQKIRHTAPQTHMLRNERLENLKGAFCVAPEHRDRINGKNIILIDDVTTTGATLLEARRALLESGARRIPCFTIAH